MGRTGMVRAGRWVQGFDGNFYGTALLGGTKNNSGVVFKMTAAGALSVLYNFTGLADGGEPASRAGPGNGWKLLWDDAAWREPRQRDGFQDHAGRDLDHAAHFCRDPGWRASRGRTHPGLGRKFLWYDAAGRVVRQRDGIQDYARGYADNSLQLRGSSGWSAAVVADRAGSGREFLRHD